MKYNINKNLFDAIDTEEKAYWLGFFYADAYNHEKRGRVVIELAEKDREHLIKCAKFFGQPREPFKMLKNKGKYVAYRLELNSKYLCLRLKNLGCPQTKSLILDFPNWIDCNLIRHFIRGYFDGDGSIYIHQNQLHLSIISTKSFLLHTQCHLTKNIQINSQLRYESDNNENIWTLYSGGTKQTLTFFNWIYADATIYLDRKYNIYEKINQIYKQAISDAHLKIELIELELKSGLLNQFEIAEKFNISQTKVSEINCGKIKKIRPIYKL